MAPMDPKPNGRGSSNSKDKGLARMQPPLTALNPKPEGRSLQCDFLQHLLGFLHLDKPVSAPKSM